MATKKETAADAVENAVETVEKTEARAEEKDDGMVTIHLFKDKRKRGKNTWLVMI